MTTSRPSFKLSRYWLPVRIAMPPTFLKRKFEMQEKGRRRFVYLTYSAKSILTMLGCIVRKFPFGCTWIRSRIGVSTIVTACAPAVSSASEFSSYFFPAAPVSGSFRRIHTPSSPLAGLRTRCEQTFLPEASVFLPRRDSYASIRPLISGGGNTSHSVRSRIAANNFRVTATSAS